uniref:Reverse transcriptase domain-containing protein n=1 Tax=Leptobrachium leishanense TaxID=445787 RepID=A0A8C5RAT6_9ANUR
MMRAVAQQRVCCHEGDPQSLYFIVYMFFLALIFLCFFFFSPFFFSFFIFFQEPYILMSYVTGHLPHIHTLEFVALRGNAPLELWGIPMLFSFGGHDHLWDWVNIGCSIVIISPMLCLCLTSSMVKITSYNVQGLNIPYKRRTLYKELDSGGADVVCLQETHFRRLSHPPLKWPSFTTQFHSTGPTKSKGVSILIRNRVVFELHRKLSDPNGRYLILVCSLNHKVYTILNLYAPNENQVDYVASILAKLSLVMTGTLLVCGDFNFSLDPLKDTSGFGSRPLVGKRKKQVDKFQSLIGTYGLYDTWRLFHPNEVDYTFFSKVHKTHTRIDYIMTQSQLLPGVESCSIGTISCSDHAPVTLTLRDEYKTFGQSPWRLNDMVLSDETAKRDLASQLESYFELNTCEDLPATTIWQAHKAVLRGHCIKWASRFKKSKEAARLLLLQKLDSLYRSHKISPSDATSRLLSEAHDELHILDRQSHFSHLQRLKTRFYAYGNKPSRLLAQRLRTLVPKQRIDKLVSPGKTAIYKPSEIAEEFASYYSSLYNLSDNDTMSHPTIADIDAYLLHLNLPALSHLQTEQLSSPFTIMEITKIISSLPHGKAPGPDGFPSAYYKAFTHLLSPHLHKVFTQASSEGRFPKEMLKATIVTLPKPGKPPTSCPNFRPISLLNTDIKIYAKLLALRLNDILPTLIGRDQVGFIKGRQGTENSKKLLALMEYQSNHGIPCLWLSLDAEKAFDRVHWKFMDRVLTKFGFTKDLIKSIMALYASPSARVLNSGFLSKTFNITNGTRQGCPLSPLLYALVLEPLAQAIRQNDLIRGVQIGPQTFKLNLFADDILITITEPLDSLPSLHTALTEYGLVSYHSLNLPKTQALAWGLHPTDLRSIKTRYSFAWNDQGIKYLGITLPSRFDDIITANHKKVFAETRSLLLRWRSVRLSWLGRAAAVKMTILPKLLYVFRMLPILVPKPLLSAVQRDISSFIWNGKRPRTPFKVLSASLVDGGLKFPQILTYHKAAIIASLSESLCYTSRYGHIFNQ